MTVAASTRMLLLNVLLWSGTAACRDVGIVGEGSACPEGCDADQRCLRGACVPRNDGVAGDDEHDDEEHHDEEHEEEPSESGRE